MKFETIDKVGAALYILCMVVCVWHYKAHGYHWAHVCAVCVALGAISVVGLVPVFLRVLNSVKK